MTAHSPVDPVALTADLIRCPSVTPAEGGALVLLEGLLSGAGFDCKNASAPSCESACSFFPSV